MPNIHLVKSHFLAALELSTPSERVAYLDDACAENPLLRQRIEALLRAHDAPDELFDQPAACHLALDSDDELYDLLEPSRKPGVLGRLGMYEVLEIVGRGGMGIVLRACDPKLNRIVAIKILSPVLATSGSSRQRFVREAQSAAAVAHDNIIAIYAVEESSSVPYLVMQYIHGCTLQEKLDRSGSLPLKEILRIGIGIADGLAAAHRNGLVHRDVKPANILLENGIERVKITDFGLARAVDDASLTRSGVIVGTPHFMSPEQANGERVDHRSDLFSLGSVLYALCTGHPPFRAETTLAVLKRVAEDTPRPIREVHPEIPIWLADLVAKLLAKDPSQRFDTAGEVANRLTSRLAQLQAGLDSSAPDHTSHEAAIRPSNRHRRTPIVRRFLIVTLVIGMLGAGWILATWTGTDDPFPTSTVPTLTVALAPSPRLVERPVSTLAEVLAQRPSPFDKRKHSDIPPEFLALVGGGKPGLALEELVAVFGEQSDPACVAISPDGQYLAAGSNDWSLRIWDLQTWKADAASPPCRVLKEHKHGVWSVAFSPDSRTLASGSLDGTIVLWDVATGRNLGALAGHSRWHSHITYSPDGRTIAAGGDDGVIHRWDVATGQRTDLAGFHQGVIRGIAYSPDGRYLATAGNDHTVQILDAATGRRLYRFSGNSNRTAVAFSPDGKTLAAGCDGPGPSVRFWDVGTGEEQPSCSGHTSHVGSLAFHPLGRWLATGSWDQSARLWDRSDSTSWVLRVGPISGQLKHVAVAFSPEGRHLVVACEKRRICIFRIPAPSP